VRTTTAALATLAALSLTACGGSDEQALTPASAAGSTPSAAVSPAPSPVPDAYTTGSDVTTHGAIGGDVKAVRDLLAPAKEGGPVDWEAVRAVFTTGGASVRGDGTVRTLATLFPDSAAVPAVEAALGGTSGLSDAARAQQVDKGMVVILTEKVIGELEAAQDKAAKGETDPAEGAPHHVDEAYAFFVADGQGPAATADKREKAPQLVGKVRAPIVAGLAAAQTAAAAGDATALAAATARTQAAFDHLYYLAVNRYLGETGEVELAEGGAFYLAIQPRVRAAVPAADTAITKGLAGGDLAAAKAALNSDAVFAALGLTAAQRVG
jgi:hypothetical protein